LRVSTPVQPIAVDDVGTGTLGVPSRNGRTVKSATITVMKADPTDVDLETAPEVDRQSGQQTAKQAAAILLELDAGFRVPMAAEREAILVAFVLEGYVVYGKAFDIVKLSRPVDLSNAADVRKNIDAPTLYEIKSTNKEAVTPNFERYFFSLSTAELLVAQNLGQHYRFAFVNVRTRTHLELSLREVFAKARGLYPTWSIQF
jgi:hypothetical protein